MKFMESSITKKADASWPFFIFGLFTAGPVFADCYCHQAAISPFMCNRS